MQYTEIGAIQRSPYAGLCTDSIVGLREVRSLRPMLLNWPSNHSFLGRPTFLLSFLSSATQRAHCTKLNQNRSHARKRMRFENACPKFGVSLPPKHRRPKNHFFRRLRNSTATLTAYIFRKKHDITTGQVH